VLVLRQAAPRLVPLVASALQSEGVAIHGDDIVAGFVVKMPFFYGLDKYLKTWLEGAGWQPGQQRAEDVNSMDSLFWSRLPKGSNSFAVAPSRSADGYTRLDINSHQPWEGPVSWYEARLQSEEGWDMVGGVFPGTPVVLHGHNRNLGWAHTVNSPDLVDIYKLHGAEPVTCEASHLKELGYEVILAPLQGARPSATLRHEPRSVAKEVIRYYRKHRRD
jgi:hypothetical protein